MIIVTYIASLIAFLLGNTKLGTTFMVVATALFVASIVLAIIKQEE